MQLLSRPLLSVALGVLMNKDNTVRQAGGFIIQLMPGASEAVISALEEKIKEIPLYYYIIRCGKYTGDNLTVHFRRLRTGNQ